jgi:hypothetical protein
MQCRSFHRLNCASVKPEVYTRFFWESTFIVRELLWQHPKWDLPDSSLGEPRVVA